MDKSDETVDYAATQASRQAPGAERAEWTAAAERVVVSHLPPDRLGRPRSEHRDFRGSATAEDGAGNNYSRACASTKPGLLSAKQPRCVGTGERFFW
jgi:hypothetical protein